MCFISHMCEIWSQIVRLEMSEKNGTEEAILTQGERGKNGSEEDCKINIFMIGTPQQILFA